MNESIKGIKALKDSQNVCIDLPNIVSSDGVHVNNHSNALLEIIDNSKKGFDKNWKVLKQKEAWPSFRAYVIPKLDDDLVRELENGQIDEYVKKLVTDAVFAQLHYYYRYKKISTDLREKISFIFQLLLSS